MKNMGLQRLCFQNEGDERRGRAKERFQITECQVTPTPPTVPCKESHLFWWVCTVELAFLLSEE